MDRVNWSILLIEDDEDDYILTRDLLRDIRPNQVTLQWAKNYDQGLAELLNHSYDVVLVDYHLTPKTGVELIHEALRLGHRSPFILLTGHDSFELDLEAMQAGFADYIPKAGINSAILERTIRYAIERQRLLWEAEEGARTLDALLEYIPEAIAIADAPGATVRRISLYGQELMGVDCSNLEGKAIDSEPGVWLKPDAPPDGETLLQQHPLTSAVLQGEVITNEELLLKKPDGSQVPVLCNAGPIRNQSMEIIGGVSAWWDISGLKRAEEERRDQLAKEEVRHRLTQQREKERLQLARDLHDGPVQELLGSIYAIQEVRATSTDSAIQEMLTDIQAKLQDQVNELRNFCNELRPPALAPFGLEKAIRSHLDGFREKHSDIQIITDLHPDGTILREETRIALYRIYQEVINNIIHHARANEIEVIFGIESDQVHLIIKDNGQGFSTPIQWVEMARQGHFGLLGIQERAEAVGGVVQVISTPGNGTKISVVVPVHNGTQTTEPQDNMKR